MRFVKLISILIILSFIIIPVISVNAAIKYVDKETNTSFTVPSNWSQFDENKEDFDAAFSSDMNYKYIIFYSSTDYRDEWKKETSEIPYTYLNNGSFSKKEFAEIYDAQESDVTIVNYGKYYYFRVEYFNEEYGNDKTMYMFVRISDGWTYEFYFFGGINSSYYQDVEYILNNVEYPYYSEDSEKPEEDFIGIETTSLSENENLHKNQYEDSNKYTNSNKEGLDILSIFFSILITIIIYTIPIVIFRYAIIKKPITNKLAIKITIIYAICGFIVMSLVCYIINQSAATGGGLVLWSFVNYKILTYGNEYLQNTIDINNESSVKLEENKYKSNKNIVEEKATKKKVNDIKRQNDIDEQSIKIEKEIRNMNKKTEKRKKALEEETLFCRKCGRKLAIDSEFCHKCGVKVIKEEDI